MKQYQVWVIIALLAAIAGVMLYSNFKVEKVNVPEVPPVTEE